MSDGIKRIEHDSTRLLHTVVGEPDADVSGVPESVIHEIWRLQHFRVDDLQTVDGRRVVILDPGRLNEDQGPDFLDARIVLGTTTWAGSVEIHRTSSEWTRHRHHTDPFYHGVILHVTLVADRATGCLERNDGSSIPEIVLYPRLRDSLKKLRWQFRKGGRLFFACQEHWMNVPDSTISPFLDRLAVDRLKRKAVRIGERFLSTADLDQILYEEIFRCLGYVQNSEAMVLLARRIPLSLLRTIADPRDGAALFLGTAGLLESPGPAGDGDVESELGRRYEDMAGTEVPPSLPKTIWRSARLRPANNPRRRILQAALLLGPWSGKGPDLMENVQGLLASENPVGWLSAFLDYPSAVAAYVAAITLERDLKLGADRRITIAVNAILPALLLRGEQMEETTTEDRIFGVLRKLPVVMDRIVRRYSAERGRPVSAAVAQGLHELSRSWCGRGKCRDCPIWMEIAGRTTGNSN